MDHDVRLATLPEGAQFPPEVQNRISYDRSRQRLCYRGFMSKADFDRLCRVHNDLAYQRALEELFKLCVFEDTASSGGWWKAGYARFIAGAVAIASVVLVAFLLFHPR